LDRPLKADLEMKQRFCFVVALGEVIILDTFAHPKSSITDEPYIGSSQAIDVNVNRSHKIGSPTRTRTLILALEERGPIPLDDGAKILVATRRVELR
jgi:hypothetical protein